MAAADCPSSFWDLRHPSLGLPVGCLIVPRGLMSIVKAALSAEGKAGRGHWLQKNGTIPCKRCSLHSPEEQENDHISCNNNRRDIIDRYKIHLTIFGAIMIEMKRLKDIPAPVRDLLVRQEIQWEPGARLSPKNDRTTASCNGVTTTCSKSDPRVRPVLFRFCELFAGIGGFRLGLEQLGGECVFSSEIDPFAAATYALNFGQPPSSGDITNVSTKEIPVHDLLVGGFPCQSFSTAGSQNGLEDHQTSNGRLYLEVCRVLCATRPKAFLLENVANLLTLDGGQFHEDPQQRKPGRAYTTIMSAFERCGYHTQTRIVNANNHNVPQHRDRLFFVGFLDAKAADRFSWPSRSVDSSSTAARATVRSVLEPSESVSVQAAILTPVQYKKVQPFLNEKVGRSCRLARLDGIARTLMASYRSGWQKHSEFVVSMEDIARFYTAREAARIMGFPDSFAIPGHPTRDHGGKAYDAYQRFYHQIGNAVCPPVITAVAESILRAIDIEALKEADGKRRKLSLLGA